MHIVKKCSKDLNIERKILYNRIKNRKILERPSKEDLLKLILSKSFLKIGRMYNVSDNTIRKWCKQYNLPFRRKDIEKIKN